MIKTLSTVAAALLLSSAAHDGTVVVNAIDPNGSAAGMAIVSRRSVPPASTSSTLTAGSSLSRDATMQPAAPAPTMMYSKESVTYQPFASFCFTLTLGPGRV